MGKMRKKLKAQEDREGNITREAMSNVLKGIEQKAQKKAGEKEERSAPVRKETRAEGPIPRKIKSKTPVIEKKKSSPLEEAAKNAKRRLEEPEEKTPHLKPKGKKGMAMVKKLGRTYKTGTFEKISDKAAKEYGSKEAGDRVAGAVFWSKAKKRG